jgi:hypothetical protein
LSVAAKGSVRTSTDWCEYLREGFIEKSINDETIVCLIKHLADLGIYKSAGEDLWEFSSENEIDSEELVRDEFFHKIEKVRQSDSGSLLKYFTGETLGEDDVKFPSGDTSKAEVGKDKKISSNLSNYQIVRKMGRQLSPFIELENNIMSRLEGTHVTRGDAKILFKYILSRIQTSEKPREWEQISRKRHK